MTADVLLLNCGLWDVKTDPKSGEAAVGIEEYAANLRAMVAVAKDELGVRQLLWCSTTPVDDHVHNVVHKQAWRRYNRDVLKVRPSAPRL